MAYRLSLLSRARLVGVQPRLVAVVERAITLTTVDFRVQEGLRTRDRQAALVQSGASQTMNSRHLTGHAVDLVALVGGKVRWDWPLYYPIARAMGRAAADLETPIRWGGCWCTRFRGDPEAALVAYAAERKAAGRTSFLDGPHFELVG